MPGQGAYNYAMDQLIKLDLVEFLKNKIHSENIPVLGVCVGMQILSSVGLEFKETKGLDLIPGTVKPLKKHPNKLPHLGWNSVKFTKEDKIFTDLKNNKDFYFIHGFYFDCENKDNILATTAYNNLFPSIIKSEKIYGFQFHPEKSLKNGIKILENFLKLR